MLGIDIDPVDDWAEAKERAESVSENTTGGVHPVMAGIGGPARAGTSLLANSGKVVSGAKKVLSGKKAIPSINRIASLPNVASKAKSGAKAIDVVPRAASAGTLGENPVDVARRTVDTARSFEIPEINIPSADIPKPDDEPEQPQGPPLAVLAAAGIAITLIIGEVIESES